jgi:hypothetical protein
MLDSPGDAMESAHGDAEQADEHDAAKRRQAILLMLDWKLVRRDLLDTCSA